MNHSLNNYCVTLHRNGSLAAVRDEPFSLPESSNELPRVFTTLRTYRLPEATTHKAAKNVSAKPYTHVGLFRPREHLARLIDSACTLALCSQEDATTLSLALARELKTALQQRCTGERGTGQSSNNLQIRLFIDADSAGIHLSQYMPPWDNSEAITLNSITGVRELPEHKTSRCALSRSARAAAERAGAQEALLVDDSGIVREGAWSNVFWFDNAGTLHSTKDHALAGITQAAVCDLAPVTYKETTLAVLQRAAEVFVTQSTSEITAVSSINSAPIGNGTYRRTRVLQEAFSIYRDNSLQCITEEIV